MIQDVKEGIAISPVGNFSKLEKNPASNLKPSGPTDYFNSYVEPYHDPRWEYVKIQKRVGLM